MWPFDSKAKKIREFEEKVSEKLTKQRQYHLEQIKQSQERNKQAADNLQKTLCKLLKEGDRRDD